MVRFLGVEHEFDFAVKEEHLLVGLRLHLFAFGRFVAGPCDEEMMGRAHDLCDLRPQVIDPLLSHGRHDFALGNVPRDQRSDYDFN